MPSPTKIILAGDFHIPYHSVRSFQALIRRIRAWKPDHLVIMGDFLDFYGISRFSKHPDRPRIPEEIRQGKDLLSQLRFALGNGKLHFCEGNHEARLTTHLLAQSPGLIGLPGLTVPEQLGISDREWHPYNARSAVLLPKVAAYHGTRVSRQGGYTVTAEMADLGAIRPVLAIGHTHRLAMIAKTDLMGTRWGVECGCLADLHQADYLKGSVNWQPGWVEVTHRWQCPPEIRLEYL